MSSTYWLVAVGDRCGLHMTKAAAVAAAGCHPLPLVVEWCIDSEDDRAAALAFAARCTSGVVVYTDGACSGNGGPAARAGVGVFWGEGDPRNACRHVHGAATNNVAELEAIEEALHGVQDTVPPGTPVTIVTDTRYGIDCLTLYYNGFVARGWQTKAGTDVKNRELLERTHALLVMLPHVQLFHVQEEVPVQEVPVRGLAPKSRHASARALPQQSNPV